MANFFASFIVMTAALLPGLAAAQAELPRLTVDTHYVEPHGRTIAVAADGNLQAALDQAKPGDVITLAPGATYRGPFVLPEKSGDGWIVVRSAAPTGDQPPQSGVVPRALPPPGRRVDPHYAPLMPKLVAVGRPVISAASGAHHYRLIGLEIYSAGSARFSAGGVLHLFMDVIRDASADTGFNGQTLVMLGKNETAEDRLPHHIIIDRCYLHGDAEHGTRRGIGLNGRYQAVIDSYLSDFKAKGPDAQAVAGWNGSGPFKIENNYMEGAAETVMFGGDDPAVKGLVPSDIEVRGNHFYKPLSWREGDPHYAGTQWTVKNLFELKNARRVLVEGNVMENVWSQAQDGFAVLLTVRNQFGASPWSVVQDVTIRNNIFRHAGEGIDILGYDNNNPSGRAQRISIRNNLFEDIGAPWGRGQLFQLLDGTGDVEIVHNTGLQTNNIVQGGSNRPHTDFVFEDNIVAHNDYGIIGDNFGPGQPTLAHYFPHSVIRRNLMVGGAAQSYPDGNYFPASFQGVGFIDPHHGDYRLRKDSRYKNAASDGSDLGVDFKALCAAFPADRWPTPPTPSCAGG